MISENCTDWCDNKLEAYRISPLFWRCEKLCSNLCGMLWKRMTISRWWMVRGNKRANKSIVTRNYELFYSTDLREWYELRVMEPTDLASLQEFQERGWVLSRILNLAVNVNKYNFLHAGCDIQLPREIRMKRAVLMYNIRIQCIFDQWWPLYFQLKDIRNGNHRIPIIRQC